MGSLWTATRLSLAELNYDVEVASDPSPVSAHPYPLSSAQRGVHPFNSRLTRELKTSATEDFYGRTKVGRYYLATTGSLFVTARSFASGPSDSGLLRTPCHYWLSHLNG